MADFGLIKLENRQLRVSSVLNKDTKQFGKQYMIDGTEETCWNSDQGSPQSVFIKFDDAEEIAQGKSLTIHAINIMFQGGFVGKVLINFILLIGNRKLTFVLLGV